MATEHNPSNFNPQDYVVVDYIDNAGPQFTGGWMAAANPSAYNNALNNFAATRQAWESKVRQYFPTMKCYRCQHCGSSRIRYVAVCKHVPTGEFVAFGDICVDRLGFASQSEFRAEQLRRHVAAQLTRQKTAKLQEAFAAQWPDVVAKLASEEACQNSFVSQMRHTFNKYGYLTEKQVMAVRRSFIRTQERVVVRNERDEAFEKAPNAPTGRVTVTGTVLTAKYHHSAQSYASGWKMVVQSDEGFRVWVSVPSNFFSDIPEQILNDKFAVLNKYQDHGQIDHNEVVVKCLPNQKVTFTATLKPSDRDAKFAFGSRPADASVLSWAGALMAL